MATPLTVELEQWDRVTALSGIEINQNQPPATESDFIAANTEASQTFALPTDFLRVNNAPHITGVQVCLKVEDADAARVDYTLEYRLNQTTWETIVSGTENGSHVEGDMVWFDVYFPLAIKVSDTLLKRQFRLTITSSCPWWYSAPDPLGQSFTEPNAAGMFRLLTSSADNGTDFLGNQYRSAVIRRPASAINTNTEAENTFWLSQPNPSKFAVESLYFDIRDEDFNPTVVDRLLVDPMTPGVNFHIYYTTEGEPGTTSNEWETKLWVPVQHSYTMNRREEFALPAPINAKYVKVEFSHLQGKYYQAGTFQQPIRYKKHPKWVLDWFLATANNPVTDDMFIARNVRVIYNALDLAYNYYLDDLRQTPNSPLPTIAEVASFLNARDDLSDRIDAETLRQIETRLAPYRDTPGSRGKRDLLGMVSTSLTERNYPTEYRVNNGSITTQVSTLDREAVAKELTFPVMYFYLTSRHVYREVEATFEHDRAYFVGVRELAFLRDNYVVPSDAPLYIEGTGDGTNVLRNDFVNVDGIWQVYEDPDEA